MDLIDEIKKQSRWHHYIVYSSVVCFISLFLSWASVGFLSASGWQKIGVGFLIPIVYNITFARDETRTKDLAYIVNIFALLAIWRYISNTSLTIFGGEINFAGEGAYLALFSFIANVYFISRIEVKKK